MRTISEYLLCAPCMQLAFFTTRTVSDFEELTWVSELAFLSTTFETLLGNWRKRKEKNMALILGLQ